MAFKNAPKPFDQILREEGITKLYPLVEKVSYLNNMKHSRHHKSLILTAAQQEKMRRLGVIGDDEICTFAPSTKYDVD